MEICEVLQLNYYGLRNYDCGLINLKSEIVKSEIRN